MITARFKTGAYWPGGKWQVFRDGKLIDEYANLWQLLKNFPNAVMS